MATGNFYYKNGLYVIGTPEDIEDYDLLVDDVIGNIQSDLNKNIGYGLIKTDYGSSLEYMHEGVISNNFGGAILYKIIKETKNYTYKIEVVIYNGYYSHNNIDYIITYSNDDCDDEDIIMQKYHNKTNKKLLDKIINVIKTYTNEYKIGARFSNGETIYNKVEE